MTQMYWNEKTLMLKAETTYGVDATPCSPHTRG